MNRPMLNLLNAMMEAVRWFHAAMADPTCKSLAVPEDGLPPLPN